MRRSREAAKAHPSTNNSVSKILFHSCTTLTHFPHCQTLSSPPPPSSIAIVFTSTIPSYLELAKWGLEEALLTARADTEWDQPEETSSYRSGDLRITLHITKSGKAVSATVRAGGEQEAMAAAAALRSQQGDGAKHSTESEAKREKGEEEEERLPVLTPSAVTQSSCTPEDIHRSIVHHGHGVEMKDLSEKKR